MKTPKRFLTKYVIELRQEYAKMNKPIPSLGTLADDLRDLTMRLDKLELRIAATPVPEKLPRPVTPPSNKPIPGHVLWHIIAYRQYNNWSVTLPFPTLAKAEQHCELYLRKTDYVKDITFLVINLPE